MSDCKGDLNGSDSLDGGKEYDQASSSSFFMSIMGRRDLASWKLGYEAKGSFAVCSMDGEVNEGSIAQAGLRSLIRGKLFDRCVYNVSVH